MEQTSTIQLFRKRLTPKAQVLLKAVAGYSPASFFSGRKYIAGIRAKMKNEA
jgi:hypothetical protein